MSHLTENFSLAEFAVSAEHPFLAKLIEFSEADEVKLFYFCNMILQPIRNKFGGVIILSGKRTPELNKAVGGAELSDHLFRYASCATDFTVPGADMKAVYNWIQFNLCGSFMKPYGQLIYYPAKQFIHGSLPTPRHRGECFIKE